MKPLCSVPFVAGILLALIAVPSVEPQEDRLVRAFLGVHSIPVRFRVPKGQRFCFLAVAKFKDGKFLGYAELRTPVESLKVANRPIYEAELGWARKDGRMTYILVTPSGTQGFQADDFFEQLVSARFLAVDETPRNRLGPFYVLGYAFGGRGKLVKDEDPDDVQGMIRNERQVVAFLLRWFETEEQAREFSKALPTLVVK